MNTFVGGVGWGCRKNTLYFKSTNWDVTLLNFPSVFLPSFIRLLLINQSHDPPPDAPSFTQIPLTLNVRHIWNITLLRHSSSSRGYFLDRFLVKTYSHPPKYVLHHPPNQVYPNLQRSFCGPYLRNQPVDTPSYWCLRRQRQIGPVLGHPGEEIALVYTLIRS